MDAIGDSLDKFTGKIGEYFWRKGSKRSYIFCLKTKQNKIKISGNPTHILGTDISDFS